MHKIDRSTTSKEGNCSVQTQVGLRLLSILLTGIKESYYLMLMWKLKSPQFCKSAGGALLVGEHLPGQSLNNYPSPTRDRQVAVQDCRIASGQLRSSSSVRI